MSSSGTAKISISILIISLPGARVKKPITDVNYGIRYATMVEKFPLIISIIYGENMLNS